MVFIVAYGHEGEVFIFHCIFFFGGYILIHEMKKKWSKGGDRETRAQITAGETRDVLYSQEQGP